MASPQQVTVYMERLSKAIGADLSEDRTATYTEQLVKLHPELLKKVCDTVIETWERPGVFPTLGTLMKVARVFRGDGTPNALRQYVDDRKNDAHAGRLRAEVEHGLALVAMDDSQYFEYLSEHYHGTSRERRTPLTLLTLEDVEGASAHDAS
jgi:hypothetical protein